MRCSTKEYEREADLLTQKRLAPCYGADTIAQVL